MFLSYLPFPAPSLMFYMKIAFIFHSMEELMVAAIKHQLAG